MENAGAIIEVLGLPAGGGPSAAATQLVRNAQTLAGGRRLQGRFPWFTGERIPISSPLEKAFSAIARANSEGRRVVVLADGDPLYFGIGARLIEYFGGASLRFTPAVTAVAAACARLGIPWNDLPVATLHGRSDMTPLLGALTAKGRAAVYTDAVNSPDILARRLLDLDIAEVTFHILENMGTPEEQARTLSIQEAAKLAFHPLNLVIVETDPAPDCVPALGQPDDFYESDHGLVTKWPARACALAALRLRPDSVVWDVGAGSGSVSVEACALAHRGRVFAVEQDSRRCGMIRANRKRARAWTLAVVEGEAPKIFDVLPDPDRIFLGGGLSGAQGGETPDILAEACARLKPGGRLAANVVLLGSLHAAAQYPRSLGWPVEITQLGAGVSSPLAGDIRLHAQNPVLIVCADKPQASVLS